MCKWKCKFLGRPRTTLGCSPPLDAQELLTRGIPQSMSSWGLPEVGLTIPVGSAQGALNRGIPQLRNFSTEEFLGWGVPGHPRVVRIQGWFLAGPKFGQNQHSCTNVRGPPVALLGFLRCSSGVALHTPWKALSHLSPFNCQACRTSSCLCKGVALQGGCSSYTCGCHATLCN